MMTVTGDLVADYMRRLERELRDLPHERRAELMAEIRDHIEEAQDEQDAWDETSMRNLLEQIGDPQAIAAEARERFEVPPRGMGLQEIAAVVLLLIGGLLLPLIGWIIGIVLLWGSTAWSDRDKWIGTLLFPGGLSLPFLLFLGGVGSYTCYADVSSGEEVCPGEPTALVRMIIIVVVILGTIGPIFSAFYLTRRARRGAH